MYPEHHSTSTHNKLNKLWKGLERVFKFSTSKKTSCRGFEKLRDFCFPPPQPDTAQSPVATAPGRRTMWKYVEYILWTFIQDICKYTYVPLRTYVHESWNCYQYSEQQSLKVLEACLLSLLYQKDQRTRLCASVLVRWLFLACVSCAKEMARSVAFVQPGTFQVQWHFLCPTCLRLVTCPLVLFPESKWQPYISSNGIVCLWIQKYSEYLELSCICETSVDVDVLGALIERCQWLYDYIMGMLVTCTAVFQSRNIWVPCHSRTRHTGRLVSHLIRFCVSRKRTTRTSELRWISLNGWAPNYIAWRLARPEI